MQTYGPHASLQNEKLIIQHDIAEEYPKVYMDRSVLTSLVEVGARCHDQHRGHAIRNQVKNVIGECHSHAQYA